MMPEQQVEAWRERDQWRFLALAFAGEVGELLNLIKKDWRGDGDWRDGPVFEELADVRIYLELLATALGYDLDAACVEIIRTKLAHRWPVEYEAAIRALPVEPA